MAKGITYFCRDSIGNLYTRYSAGHAAPQYTHAVIHRQAGTRDAVGKSAIQYSGREELARNNLHYWNSSTMRGRGYEAEMLKVWSAPGRAA